MNVNSRTFFVFMVILSSNYYVHSSVSCPHLWAGIESDPIEYAGNRTSPDLPCNALCWTIHGFIELKNYC